MRTHYAVNEIFWSPQGEGMRAGQMSVFIRLVGCNLQCAIEEGAKSIGGFDCDTEFVSGRKMTLDEIITAARAECAMSNEWFKENKAWIVLTGGEPSLQTDKALVDALHDAGFLIAMETNGSNDVSALGLDWITVSPKVAEHCIRQMTADEIKYVRGHGQGVPVPSCKAEHRLISPAFNGLTIDRRSLEWCVQLIKENPQWRLSVQMHKAWRVR